MTVLALLILLLTGVAVFALMGNEIMEIINPVKNDWVEEENRRYYHDEDGDHVTGWFVHEGNTYYLNPLKDGAMHIGWIELDGRSYYMDLQGCMLTGWQEIDGETYYLSDNGAKAIGWITLEEGTYYLNENGNPVSGWLELGGKEYFLGHAGLVTGWMELDGSRYWFDESGIRATGLTEIDGTVYFLREDGSADAGWAESEGKTYYVNFDGTLAHGWVNLEGGRYYLDETGARVTGWLEQEGTRYYLREDGTMATGRVEIDGVARYFTSTGAYIVMVNRWNPVPEDYEADLVWFDSWQVDSSCYNDLIKMLADCPYPYTITSAYRSKASQQAIWDTRLARHKSEGYSDEGALKMVEDYVAVPGTSEHQLGLAVDISGAEAQYWLSQNCWNYGFIIRYPDGKSDVTGIAFEKWHFRYVGQELAQELKGSNLCLEEYLDALTADGTTASNPDKT